MVTQQPPLSDSHKRKAQKIALKMFAAQRLGLTDEVRRLSRQLARLGIKEVRLRPKE